jgi:hypothetical protein
VSRKPSQPDIAAAPSTTSPASTSLALPPANLQFPPPTTRLPDRLSLAGPRARDSSASLGSIAAEARPPTQRASDPAPLSHPSLNRPLANTGTRKSSDAQASTALRRRGTLQLSRSLSRLESGKRRNNTGAARSQAAKDEKMHQTSSRLLRMTDDERPFTRVSANISSCAGARDGMARLPLRAATF